MSEKQGKLWYQKGAVQAAFVAGVIGALLAMLRPEPPPQVVVVQAAPQPALTTRGNKTPAPAPGAVTAAPVQQETPAEGRSSLAVKETKHSSPPNTEPQPEVGHPRTLEDGKVWFLLSISTAVTATFRQTLGSHYIEIAVATPGQASTRFPARSAGTVGQFSIGAVPFEIQVLAIDWQRSRVDVIVRQLPASEEDSSE